MKVSYLISLFLGMMLFQAAVATEQFDLLPCTEGDSGGLLYCIEYDSMGDMCYLHDNITRTMTVKLPLPMLTQLWLKQDEIAIVTPSGHVISNGQKLIRSQDRDRWTIVFNFQQMDSDYGKLHLVLHIKDVTYRDTQSLIMEIRTAANIFVTRGKTWFPVDDLEGEATTTDNPTTEDPSAILHARIETLQSEKKALQEEKIAAENASIHYQTKYYHCLETKDDMKETTKPKFNVTGQNGLDITTLTLVGFIATVCICIAFILKGSKLVSNADVTLVNPTDASFYVELKD